MTELLLKPDLGKDASWSIASFETEASVTVDQLRGSVLLQRQIEEWEAQMRKIFGWEPLDQNVLLYEAGHPVLEKGLESQKGGALLLGTPIQDLSKRKWQLRRQFVKPVMRIEYDDDLPTTYEDDGANDEWDTSVKEPGISLLGSVPQGKV
jgi:hypothetical protein